jgi:hypothetical protein
MFILNLLKIVPIHIIIVKLAVMDYFILKKNFGNILVSKDVSIR